MPFYGIPSNKDLRSCWLTFLCVRGEQFLTGKYIIYPYCFLIRVTTTCFCSAMRVVFFDPIQK